LGTPDFQRWLKSKIVIMLGRSRLIIDIVRSSFHLSCFHYSLPRWMNKVGSSKVTLAARKKPACVNQTQASYYGPWLIRGLQLFYSYNSNVLAVRTNVSCGTMIPVRFVQGQLFCRSETCEWPP
jgi:hypothetical protein